MIFLLVLIASVGVHAQTGGLREASEEVGEAVQHRNIGEGVEMLLQQESRELPLP